MNELTFSTLPYQEFETPVKAQGKQYFGYAGLFNCSSDMDASITNSIYYVSLLDGYQKTLHFQVNRVVCQSIQARQSSLTLERGDFLYLWVEAGENNEVLNWRLFVSTLTLPEIYPAYQACSLFESFYQLFDLIHSIKTIPLRMFCRTLLADNALLLRFVSLPASKRHHHSFPSGLLAHSLECAFIAMQNVKVLPDLSITEKEVTVIAALLHDIGKTKTIGTQEHTALGRLLDHEQLSLMTIAEPLNQLNHYWPKGSETLQYLLTWNPRMEFCRFVGGNIIKAADQLSTSMSLRRMGFENKPAYHHFSKLKIGESNHFLNRLP